MRALTLVELLVVIAILALLAALLLPSFTAQMEKGQQSKCAANLRAICNAAFQFAADNNGILGGATGTQAQKSMTGGRFYHWPTDYLPYMGRPDGASSAQMFTPTQAYICPMNKLAKPTRSWHAHYSMNYLIGHRDTFPWPRLHAISRPSQTLLFMTGGFAWDPTVPGHWLNMTNREDYYFPFKGNSLANVAFADGHVKLMTRAELNPWPSHTKNPDVAGPPWTFR
jgi:type IV pilus assembly protein PilA